MRVLILITFLFVVNLAHGQVLTHKHKAKLETVADSAKRAKLLKRYLKKDSIKYQRKLASLKHRLKGVLRDSIKALPGFENIEHLAAFQLPDSNGALSNLDVIKGMGMEKLNKELPVPMDQLPTDSAGLATVKQQGLAKAKQEALEELGIDVPDLALDSINKTTMMKRLESEAERQLQEQLGGLEGTPDLLSEQKAVLEQLRQSAQMDAAKQQMKTKMTSHAKTFIARHADKIQQVQSKMGGLKRKFSFVPNSLDMSSARKRSSLRDEPLFKRLIFGGNFNVSKTNPVMLDLAPSLGYRLNTRFEIGAAGMYRTQLEADKRGLKSGDGETFGYSGYARYMVFRNFFGYLEGENISREVVAQDQVSRQWIQSMLLGIGREFALGKWLQFQTVVTYNFLHENQNGVYGSPVVLKTGIRWNRGQ